MIGNSDSSGAKAKKIPDAYLHQISILRALCKHGKETEIKPLSIEDVSVRSGLKDDKEALRYLYILEGQKLVSPFPAGDFTSRDWIITKEGLRALKTVDASGQVAA